MAARSSMNPLALRSSPLAIARWRRNKEGEKRRRKGGGRERSEKRTVAGGEKGKGTLVRKECACSLRTTGPGDILSRVYLRGAGVINHGFVCLREFGPGRTRTCARIHERSRTRSRTRYVDGTHVPLALGRRRRNGFSIIV